MADPICIQCGHATRSTDRLNRLADGKVCPACRERVLAELPPALPASAQSESGRGPAKARVRRPRRAKRERA
ncbi:MAG: hypothetical protein L6Q99_09195 [Planctomycetes bacterium]|nr:hypothetical protein [Planctomycetota bacterium]